MRTAPCYKCPRRSAECHAACEDYAAWKADRQQYSDKIMARAETEYLIIDGAVRTKIRNEKTRRK